MSDSYITLQEALETGRLDAFARQEERGVLAPQIARPLMLL